MPERGPDELAAAWGALEEADWTAARDSFAAHLAAHPEDPAALDGLGRALWWLGEPGEGIDCRRRAFAIYKQQGELREAANLAVYLAGEHRIASEDAAANGWLARARRLLEDQETGAAHGWLAVEDAKRASSRPDEQERHARAAAAIARQVADADLEAAALAQLGLARVDAGEIGAGMTLLDEAMAIAVGGEASDPLAIGDTCCTTLVACDRLADFEHAADWCRTVVEFTGRRGYTPLHSWCRTIYAGVLIATGEWPRAEQELQAALATIKAMGAGGRDAFPLGRLAELRIRQGRLGEAEVLLAGHEDDPQTLGAAVGLALARGEPSLACARALRGLEATGDDPALLAALLPICAEALIASGEGERAAAVAARMRGLGERLDRANLIALAQFADARIAAAYDDADRARPLFESALEIFGELRMPLEAGRARLELARIAEPELALIHARAALAAFERLGARGYADECAAFLRERGASGRSGVRLEGELTGREREVLGLLAEGLSNRAIGERLFISPKTAEHHVGRILGKLGLKSRAEAAAYAVRGGSGGSPPD